MDPTRTCTAQLALDLSAPACARRLARVFLGQWGVRGEDDLDAVALVVTELVTNALVHGAREGTVELALELQDGAVRVTVTDRDPELPRQREADDGDEGGRGLSIVDELSTDWGSEPVAVGKRVFAVLPLTSVRCA